MGFIEGKMCNIHNVEIDENTTHYLVEFKEFKTLYENDLPLFTHAPRIITYGAPTLCRRRAAIHSIAS